MVKLFVLKFYTNNGKMQFDKYNNNYDDFYVFMNE